MGEMARGSRLSPAPLKSNHIKLSHGLREEMFDMSALHPNTLTWTGVLTHAYSHTDAEIASVTRLDCSRVKQIAKVCANKNNVWKDLFRLSLSLSHTHIHMPPSTT